MAKFNFEYYSAIPSHRDLIKETGLNEKLLNVNVNLGPEFRYVDDDHLKHHLRQVITDKTASIIVDKFWSDGAGWKSPDDFFQAFVMSWGELSQGLKEAFRIGYMKAFQDFKDQEFKEVYENVLKEATK